MSDFEDVLVAALRLPAEARAALAAELIRSLDEIEDAPEEVEAAWAEEIRQRLADVDVGVVTPIPCPEARRRIFAAARGRQELQPAALAHAEEAAARMHLEDLVKMLPPPKRALKVEQMDRAVGEHLARKHRARRRTT